MPIFYEWYEIARDARGRERRRKLRWRMTVPDLIAHGQRANTWDRDSSPEYQMRG
jgi:hypothetical protein